MDFVHLDDMFVMFRLLRPLPAAIEARPKSLK
jgi:hypothetical protein